MTTVTRSDAILVGGGIASATLAALLSALQPDWRITVLERLDAPALESSAAWNNAGTGHAAYCELNYTPERPDGTIDVTKALSITEQFQVSRQFWAHLVEAGAIADPSAFIHPVPHLSLVRGAADADYLRRRHAALVSHPLFDAMEFTDDRARIEEWTPLVVEGRDPSEAMAATRMSAGSDVDFGVLTRLLLAHAATVNTELVTGVEVTDLRALPAGTGRRWGLRTHKSGVRGGEETVYTAPFVFLGAGGGALSLLQRSGIQEGRGFGGFPVSGQFLRCTDPDVVARHHGKVYGKPEAGAPPMSQPHLDTRVVDGRPALMFGPYAGFSPRFLKTGSLLDLPRSVRPDNLLPMLAVARDNLGLVAYLLRQLAMTPTQRFDELRTFMPSAQEDDWELITAGQRVQVIAPDTKRTGSLQFGTEAIVGGGGSLSALLGASPGASTSPSIMLGLLGRAFPDKTSEWAGKITQMVPTAGHDLADRPDLARSTMARTAAVLGLEH